MAAGIYESIITTELAQRLSAVQLVAEHQGVDDADAPHILARHVARAVEQALAGTRGAEERLRIVNDVLLQVARSADAVHSPAQQLTRLSPAPGPGVRVLPDA